MILMEVTAAVDGLGTLQSFYFGGVPYQTRSSDTPANINFEGRLTDAGSLGVNVYGDGRTSGYGELQVGQVKVANKDGAFDIFKNYGFDGRPVILRMYRSNTPYQAMPVVFTGTVDALPEVTTSDVIFRLKDQQQRLEVPACPNLYGGTNVLPNGIDGVPGDLKGKRKSKVYGSVANIEPECVNTSLLIYRVNDGAVQAISAVYDKAAPLTPGADYPTNALLAAATISAGFYATCLAEGLFRINGAPSGTITADVTQGAASADRTAAQVIKQIALLAGLGSAEISADDVEAMDLLQPAEVGIWITGETTAREAIGQVAASVGGYAIFDNVAVLRVGILSEPEGTPVLELTDTQMISMERVAQRDGDLPVFEVRLNHTKNWTVQTTDVAGSVAVDRRNFLKEQWRTAPAKDENVKTQFLLAPTYTIESLIYDPTNAPDGPADTEAKRQLDLFKVRRDMFEIKVNLDVFSAGVPRLMSLIQVRGSRYLTSTGRLFWLTGIALELKRSQAILTVWG